MLFGNKIYQRLMKNIVFILNVTCVKSNILQETDEYEISFRSLKINISNRKLLFTAEANDTDDTRCFDCLVRSAASILKALNCTTMAGQTIRLDLIPSWSFALRQCPDLLVLGNEEDNQKELISDSFFSSRQGLYFMQDFFHRT